MSERLRLLAGACLILIALFWNNLGDIIPTIPDEDEKIVIEEPDSDMIEEWNDVSDSCLLYTSPSPRDLSTSRMPSSA